MPPRVKITKDMVVDAAFEVVREMGAENINVRTVAKKLGCSTQPIMYHFATIKELKKTVYSLSFSAMGRRLKSQGSTFCQVKKKKRQT